MRAGLITGIRQCEVTDVAEPTPVDGSAVVEIRLCGICGSDVHAYAEGWQYAPQLCGHEWFGEVVATGAGVDSVRDGDLVMAGLGPGCGRCSYCTIGQVHYCRPANREYNGMGPHASPNGGFASLIGVDADRLVVLPEDITPVQGALVEPAAVAFHAIQQSGMRSGDTVAVLGAGPIGQLTAMCARLAGAAIVIVIEPDAERRELSVQLGADIGLDGGSETRSKVRELTAGRGVDVAFDAAGIPQTLEASIDLLRRGGTACMVGVSGKPTEVMTNKWMTKEITLTTSILYTKDEAHTVGQLIATGRLAATALHQGTIGLDELPGTVEQMANREVNALKLLVDPTR
jgi:(R,R)-butanediol dehydrogenase / meso-butanediol dehydrogenase / diacetyl reductase